MLSVQLRSGVLLSKHSFAERCFLLRQPYFQLPSRQFRKLSLTDGEAGAIAHEDSLDLAI
jgi:hypothetical protein